ncbi:hypothetical protein D3C75_676370 [compost metagenome]
MIPSGGLSGYGKTADAGEAEQPIGFLVTAITQQIPGMPPVGQLHRLHQAPGAGKLRVRIVEADRFAAADCRIQSRQTVSRLKSLLQHTEVKLQPRFGLLADGSHSQQLFQSSPYLPAFVCGAKPPQRNDQLQIILSAEQLRAELVGADDAVAAGGAQGGGHGNPGHTQRFHIPLDGAHGNIEALRQLTGAYRIPVEQINQHTKHSVDFHLIAPCLPEEVLQLMDGDLAADHKPGVHPGLADSFGYVIGALRGTVKPFVDALGRKLTLGFEAEEKGDIQLLSVQMP